MDEKTAQVFGEEETTIIVSAEYLHIPLAICDTFHVLHGAHIECEQTKLSFILEMLKESESELYTYVYTYIK